MQPQGTPDLEQVAQALADTQQALDEARTALAQVKAGDGSLGAWRPDTYACRRRADRTPPTAIASRSSYRQRRCKRAISPGLS
jgi:hypothetical protein